MDLGIEVDNFHVAFQDQKGVLSDYALIHLVLVSSQVFLAVLSCCADCSLSCLGGLSHWVAQVDDLVHCAR